MMPTNDWRGAHLPATIENMKDDKRRLRRLCRVAGAWFAAAALLPAAASAESLVIDNGRLFIGAKINGVASEALLDSGAEASLVDPALAKAARLGGGRSIKIKGSGGSADAHIVGDVTIETLGVTMKPEAVVVTDLGDLSRRLLKRPTQMIVGRELFDSARLAIDLRAGTIAVADATTPPRGRRLALTARAGIEAIPAAVNGIRVQAEFDLGNGSDVLISRRLAKRLRLEAVGRRAGGGIGGHVDRDLVRIKQLAVAGVRFRNVVAAIDDQPNAAPINVGTSILETFRIVTDFKQRVVWLEPIRG